MSNIEQTLSIIKPDAIERNLENEIKQMFKEKGFEYLDWKVYCSELFANEKNLTSIKPSKEASLNLDKALKIFKNYGQMDIGQSLVIQNEIVLGLEASEGTDNLILRCKDLKKTGDKGVLFKASKYNQSNILDIPTIGKETIQLLIQNNYEGVFIEKNQCIIIDKNETINLADRNDLFISTFDKN